MGPQLSKKELVSRDVLKRLVDVRLAEANTLRDGGFFAGAVYLCGYAIECQLKVAICSTLELTMLPGTFRTHDLELLLLHSGLHKRLTADKEVSESFKKVCGVWNSKMDLRY